jgi:ribonuclease HII
MPDFSLEREAGGIVAGIDEVGRGPWAGPVLAAAVIIDRATLPAALASIIDDSKKLSKNRRNEIAFALPEFTRIGLGAASTGDIATYNILGATMLAMQRAVAALGVPLDNALVDGNRLPDLPCPARAVVKGDSVSLSIAAASVIAKVTRDRIMQRLGARYPGFGWERNAGYGTTEHRAGLERLGVTNHHRKSYAPIIKMLSQE